MDTNHILIGLFLLLAFIIGLIFGLIGGSAQMKDDNKAIFMKYCTDHADSYDVCNSVWDRRK